MTLFEYLSDDLDRIKHDVKIGIVSTTVLNHIQIYSRYDYYKKLHYPTSFAIMYVGEDMKVSESTVFRIIKNMEKEL